jgi:hypothetical protein
LSWWERKTFQFFMQHGLLVAAAVPVVVGLVFLYGVTVVAEAITEHRLWTTSPEVTAVLMGGVRIELIAGEQLEEMIQQAVQRRLGGRTFTCDKCGAPMKPKTGRRGPFLSCSNSNPDISRRRPQQISEPTGTDQGS